MLKKIVITLFFFINIPVNAQENAEDIQLFEDTVVVIMFSGEVPAYSALCMKKNINFMEIETATIDWNNRNSLNMMHAIATFESFTGLPESLKESLDKEIYKNVMERWNKQDNKQAFCNQLLAALRTKTFDLDTAPNIRDSMKRIVNFLGLEN